MNMKPVSMRCNQQEWKEIKPILEKHKIKIDAITNFKGNSYLINNLDSNLGLVSNSPYKNIHNRTVFEEWNKEIFLEYCGIKEEKPKLILDDAYIVECENSKESTEVANFIPIITLKEWKELFNQTKENMSYKYTPQYCKNNKVYFQFNSRKELESLMDICGINKNEHAMYEKGFCALFHSTLNESRYNTYTTNSFYVKEKYEIIQASEFIKNNTKNMQKEIIGYKLIKEDYYNAAMNLAPNCFFSGHKIFDKTTTAIKHWKDAGVLDIWFEPIYKSEEKIINIGFDVKVTSEGIFHDSDNITEFVMYMNDYYSNHSITLDSNQHFGDYTAVPKDVIFSKTGCQNVETKLSDWKMVWEAYQEMIK